MSSAGCPQAQPQAYTLQASPTCRTVMLPVAQPVPSTCQRFFSLLLFMVCKLAVRERMCAGALQLEEYNAHVGAHRRKSSRAQKWARDRATVGSRQARTTDRILAGSRVRGATDEGGRRHSRQGGGISDRAAQSKGVRGQEGRALSYPTWLGAHATN